MTLWLGINEDLFDSGVALGDGERVLFASNEERYTRRKNEGGFPRQALESLFAFTGADPCDIDVICMSGLMTPPPPVRLLPRSHLWIYNARREKKDSFLRKFLDDVTFYLPVSHTSETSLLRRFAALPAADDAHGAAARCGANPFITWNTTWVTRPRHGNYPALKKHWCFPLTAWATACPSLCSTAFPGSR